MGVKTRKVAYLSEIVRKVEGESMNVPCRLICVQDSWGQDSVPSEERYVTNLSGVPESKTLLVSKNQYCEQRVDLQQ